MHQIINSSVSVSSDDHLIRTAEKQERLWHIRYFCFIALICGTANSCRDNSALVWVIPDWFLWIGNYYISINLGFMRFSALKNFIACCWFDLRWFESVSYRHETWFQGFPILSSFRVGTGDSGQRFTKGWVYHRSSATFTAINSEHENYKAHFIVNAPNSCVANSPLVGYHSCESGAVFNIICTTDFGSAISMPSFAIPT